MVWLTTLYILSIPILWVLYLAVMNLQQVRYDIPQLTYKLGMTLMYIALVWDIIVNIFVVSFIFLQIPKEATVSARLCKLVKTSGWRKDLAVWFAVNLLNPFSGNKPHIKLQQF